MNSINTIRGSGIRLLGAGALLSLLAPAWTQAQLVIDTGDIVDNKYQYSLKYDDMSAWSALSSKSEGQPWEATGNKFFDDVASFSNVRMSQFWGDTRYAVNMRPGSTSAEFVYQFDFSDIGRTIEQFTITQGAWRREADGTWLADGDKRAVTSMAAYYSIDNGATWNVIEAMAPGNGYLVTVPNEFTLDLVDQVVSSVWFKMEFESSQAIRGSYTYNLGGQQHTDAEGAGGPNWNYSSGTSSPFFEIDVTLNPIPEPATVALLMGGAALAGAMLLRRRRLSGAHASASARSAASLLAEAGVADGTDRTARAAKRMASGSGRVAAGALLGALALAGMSQQLDAQIEIGSADITGGRYLYQLSQQDMKSVVPAQAKVPDWGWEATGNKLLDDAYSFYNIRMTGSHWSFLQLKPGARKGGVIYRFDFSKTGQAPKSFRVSERLRFEADGSVWNKRATTSFASYYRLGEQGEWVKINSIEDVNGYKGDSYVVSDPVEVNPADSAVVFFKVELTSDQPLHGGYLKKGEKGAVLDRGGPLWNFTRTDQPDEFFRILFDLVPAAR